jgi:type IV fimbrial biogenesis protein FimT
VAFVPTLTQQKGFTLVELMITVIIVAVLLSLAAPGFVELLERNRLQSAASNLYTSLVLARSEALKRNTPVVVCRRDPATGKCATTGTAGDWRQGWVVHPAADPNDVLVLREGVTGGDTLWVVSASTKIDDLSYGPDGGASRVASFVLCNNQADTASGREVQVEVTGKPRMKNETSNCTP